MNPQDLIEKAREALRRSDPEYDQACDVLAKCFPDIESRSISESDMATLYSVPRDARWKEEGRRALALLVDRALRRHFDMEHPD